MFKSIWWLGKLVAAGLILSFLSIWTTGYIVTSYVDSILKQYELPLEMPPMAMSGVWGDLWGANPPLISDMPDNVEAEGVNPEAVEAMAPIRDLANSDVGNSDSGEDNSASLPAESVDDEDSLTSIDGSETAMTTEQITDAKEQMDDEDRKVLFELLMPKLPQESWQELSTYIEAGLTEQELISVQQIMAQYLNKEEYEQMLDILKKY